MEVYHPTSKSFQTTLISVYLVFFTRPFFSSFFSLSLPFLLFLPHHPLLPSLSSPTSTLTSSRLTAAYRIGTRKSR